jgi:hypothetical protein
MKSIFQSPVRGTPRQASSETTIFRGIQHGSKTFIKIIILAFTVRFDLETPLLVKKLALQMLA